MENAILLQKDFKTFLAADLAPGCVDLFLTDPPYSISKDTGFLKVKNGVKRFAVSMDFGKWDWENIDLNQLCSGMFNALRRGGTAIVFYDVWKISKLSEAMEQAGFKMIRLLIWEKTNPVPLNQRATYLSNAREIAVVGVKDGKPTFHSQYDRGVYSLPIPRHNGNRIHPTQKPLDLFEELVAKHSHEGDLVVDPFLGSGTTAIACLNTDRRFTGCEIDNAYFKKAKQRLQLHEKKEINKRNIYRTRKT